MEGVHISSSKTEVLLSLFAKKLNIKTEQLPKWAVFKEFLQMEKRYGVEVIGESTRAPSGPRKTEKFCSLQFMKSANKTKIDLTKELS